MNVYDWDGTIYEKDTTGAFYLWCLRMRPRIALRWPGVILAFLRWKLGLIDKTSFKQTLLSFLSDVPDVEAQIELFWDREIAHIHRWYLRQKRPDDLIITASPQGFVEPALRKLGLNRIIGSPVDIRTGRYQGVNCDGANKVAALEKAYPGAVPDRFYSDSLNDAPLARRAKEAFFVRGECLEAWPKRE